MMETIKEHTNISNSRMPALNVIMNRNKDKIIRIQHTTKSLIIILQLKDIINASADIRSVIFSISICQSTSSLGKTQFLNGNEQSKVVDVCKINNYHLSYHERYNYTQNRV